MIPIRYCLVPPFHLRSTWYIPWKTNFLFQFNGIVNGSGNGSGNGSAVMVLRTCQSKDHNCWFSESYSMIRLISLCWMMHLKCTFPGVISVFDQRTGVMNATWKPYESDVVQLLAISPSLLISIGNDNGISIWDLKRDPDDRLLYSIRAAFSDPILNSCFVPRSGNSGAGDLLALLGNNRIGVLGDILKGGTSMVTTKIRPNVFKGNCMTMAVLPLNRQLLVGGESGSCMLLC